MQREWLDRELKDWTEKKFIFSSKSIHESNPQMAASRTCRTVLVGESLSYYWCLFTFNINSPWQQKELSYSLSSLLRNMRPSLYHACSWDTPPGCIHNRTYQQYLWTDESRTKTAWSINDWWKKRKTDKKITLWTALPKETSQLCFIFGYNK